MIDDKFERAVTAGVIAWENRARVKFVSTAEEHVRAIMTAAYVQLIEDNMPDVCPFDCDLCHSDDCPCDRLGCAGHGSQ
jgi:hypothetical protein